MNRFTPKSNSQDILFLITKITDILTEKTKTELHETIEDKLNTSSECFLFETPLDLEDKLMLGFTSLEVYNFVSSICEKK